MRFAVLCLLLCTGGTVLADLQSDVQDVIAALPLRNIESLGKQYVASYSSFRNKVRYVEENTFDKLVKNFLETPEGQEVIDYFKERNLDVEKAIHYVVEFMSTINSKWLEPMKLQDFTRPAITDNFFADLSIVLKESDFSETVHNKMDTSSEFAKLVAAVKDPKFKHLLYRSVNSSHLIGGLGNQTEVRFWGWLIQVGLAVGQFLYNVFSNRNKENNNQQN